MSHVAIVARVTVKEGKADEYVAAFAPWRLAGLGALCDLPDHPRNGTRLVLSAVAPQLLRGFPGGRPDPPGLGFRRKS